MKEKYLVFVVGGENDGEIVAKAETYVDAVRAAKEAEKVYGVIAIDCESGPVEW